MDERALKLVLRCVECKRMGRGSSSTRWCDRCGGELRPVHRRSSSKRKRGRR